MNDYNNTKKLLIKMHGEYNPLFSDNTYLMAIEAALKSPCQKMGFGVPILYRGKIVAVTNNKPLEVAKHICDPKCIRFDIPSRTESMLGACNHAEEWALDEIRNMRIDPSECYLYVAGVHRGGKPWIKNDATFSCIRCANQLYRANIAGLFVPVVDHWKFVLTENLIEQALEYATQKKTA